jgi:hypothetical protein
VGGVAAAQPHPHAPDDAVGEAADAPEEVRVRPAGIAAQALDLGEGSFRRGGDPVRLAVDDR